MGMFQLALHALDGLGTSMKNQLEQTQQKPFVFLRASSNSLEISGKQKRTLHSFDGYDWCTLLSRVGRVAEALEALVAQNLQRRVRRKSPDIFYYIAESPIFKMCVMW